MWLFEDFTSRASAASPKAKPSPDEPLFRSLDSVQRALGLPHFDFSEVAYLDPDGRLELIPGPEATWGQWLTYKMGRAKTAHYASPMLEATREFLNGHYAASGKELRAVLGEGVAIPESWP